MYNTAGMPQTRVVTIPAPGDPLNASGAPTGLVFNVAGGCGLGTLAAAKQKGVWGIGVDIDQSYLGRFILTSVIKRLDVAVYQLVQSLEQGRFRTGGNVVFDFRNNGVGLGRFSPVVTRSLQRQLAPLRAQIVGGEIKVPTTVKIK